MTPFVLKTATPIPSASAPPTGAAISVPSRPLANGDSFKYSGTTTQSFVYMGTNPSPAASSSAAVTQTVTVATGKSFNGASNLDDFTTTETDTTPNQTTTITTNTYYAMTSGGPTDTTTGIEQEPLTTYGFTSTDSDNESLTYALTNPGFANNSGTVDLLPEETTPTWTNGIAETIDQSESDGFTAVRTYKADGSYTETDTYPQSSAASPQPTALTATIQENSDGSGTYDLPLFGPPNTTITYDAPTSAGQINITLSNSSGSATEMASAWFPQPLSSANPLYSELDRDNGAVTYPSACNQSGGQYGTQGNEVEKKYTRIDTILGTLEFFDQLTFVSSSGVAACVVLNDVTYVYYDYSGQTNSDVGPGYSGGNSPLETQTITTTLGVQGGAIANSVGRQSQATVAARNASAVANARANFVHTVDHFRAQRERAMYAHFRNALTRLHR
jgi:hypothetical protein